MLSKLLKHEFIAVSRVLVPLHLVLALVTVIGKATLSLEIWSHLPDLLTFLMLLTYIVVVIAVPIVTCIFLLVRFYRNLYSDEGYLMWTLPAKPWEHLLSKGIVSSVWQIADIALLCGSIFLLVDTGELGEALADPTLQVEINGALQEQLGISLSGFVGYMVATCVIGCVCGCFMCYFAVCLGQLFSKHRVLGAFLAYFLLYMIMQVANTAVLLHYGLALFSDDEAIAAVYGEILTAGIVLSVVYGVVCYIGTLFLMKKKVNLQ